MRNENDLDPKNAKRLKARAKGKKGNGSASSEAERIADTLAAYAAGDHSAVIDVESIRDPALKRIAEAASNALVHATDALAREQTSLRSVGQGVDAAVAALVRFVV